MKSQHKADSQKLLYDLFKHLTTINTGSVLLLITLLEKFFKSPKWSWLIATALTTFLLSVAASLFTMYMLAIQVEEEEDFQGGQAAAGISLIIIAIGGFLVGLASVAIFALKNFYA